MSMRMHDILLKAGMYNTLCVRHKNSFIKILSIVWTNTLILKIVAQ